MVSLQSILSIEEKFLYDRCVTYEVKNEIIKTALIFSKLEEISLYPYELWV